MLEDISSLIAGTSSPGCFEEGRGFSVLFPSLPPKMCLSLNKEFTRLQVGCTNWAEAVGKVLGLWRFVAEMLILV